MNMYAEKLKPGEKQVKESKELSYDLKKVFKRTESAREKEIGIYFNRNDEHFSQDAKVFYVRKNQIDPSAGILYSLGCSLLHFSLLIGIFFIEGPRIENAKSNDVFIEKLLKMVD